jgi:hypothetical protein
MCAYTKGTVGLWNVNENADRLNDGCSRMMMPAVPSKIFNHAVHGAPFWIEIPLVLEDAIGYRWV